MPIRAILFDLDETSTEHERPLEESYLATSLLAALRYEVDAARVVVAQYEAVNSLCDALKSRPFLRQIRNGGRDILWGDATGVSPELNLLAEEIPQFRFDVWRSALESVGVKDLSLARRMAERFPQEVRSRLRAYPDGRPAVDAAARKFKIGVVTNGLPASQREKLRICGFDGYFEHVTVSGEMGIAKPDARILGAALRDLGVGPGEAALVGDRLDADISGARALGMRAIWLNRHGSIRTDDSPLPDVEILTLDNLSAAVA